MGLIIPATSSTEAQDRLDGMLSLWIPFTAHFFAEKTFIVRLFTVRSLPLGRR